MCTVPDQNTLRDMRDARQREDPVQFGPGVVGVEVLVESILFSVGYYCSTIPGLIDSGLKNELERER